MPRYPISRPPAPNNYAPLIQYFAPVQYPTSKNAEKLQWNKNTPPLDEPETRPLAIEQHSRSVTGQQPVMDRTNQTVPYVWLDEANENVHH